MLECGSLPSTTDGNSHAHYEEAVLTSHKTLLLSHLCYLGLRVNFAKSILSPSQRVSFLCTVIESMKMTETVSAERAMTIQRHAASFEEGTARPLKAFQRMLGLMVVASPVLRLVLLHMRPFQFWLKQRVPSTAWHHGRHRVTVTLACVSALARWRNLSSFSLTKARHDLRHGAQKEGCHDRCFQQRSGSLSASQSVS